mmetsp:Transcript_13807/g.37434  ORF Transcript_13807/g.37434 Transcript_13807/m.37434 type:complete len:536 (-) Transcript_13807:155-1762(-)
MLQSMLFGRQTDAVQERTEAVNALVRLEDLYAALHKIDGVVDTASDTGYLACSEFLEGVAVAAEAMRLEAVSRDYRDKYSINYQMLFPDKARNYRVDLLGASAGNCSVIWVNGDKFEFSTDAVLLASDMQDAWARLCLFLDHRGVSKHPATYANVVEVKPLLETLDNAWAVFEHTYISELIEIEDKARGAVVEAVEHELKLQAIEDRYGFDAAQNRADYVEARRDFISCLGHLNAVANFHRKGRDDLGIDVLESAYATLHACSAGRLSDEDCAVARNLAIDVLDSYQAIRDYLSEVSGMLSRVDPHLRNNPGLVARLVDLEETWEIGSRYMADVGLMEEFCGLVSEVRATARSVPSLSTLCEHCDVELFLCLPRMVWLRYFADPAQRFALVRAMLPHRFTKEGRVAAPALAKLLDDFERTRQTIRQAMGVGGFETEAVHNLDDAEADINVRLLLAQRAATGGVDEMRRTYSTLFPHMHSHEPVVSMVEALMHDLEAWSMELQRHCPEDWNQFAAVLVQMLTEGGQRKDRQSPFRV